MSIDKALLLRLRVLHFEDAFEVVEVVAGEHAVEPQDVRLDELLLVLVLVVKEPGDFRHGEQVFEPGEKFRELGIDTGEIFERLRGLGHF